VNAAPGWPRSDYNVRLAEAASLAAIDALIAEASIEAEQARANKDRTARRIAIARRNAATKRGLEFSSFSNNRRTAEEWARRHSESAN
jgi:hypothetical protein